MRDSVGVNPRSNGNISLQPLTLVGQKLSEQYLDVAALFALLELVGASIVANVELGLLGHNTGESEDSEEFH